MMDTLYQSPVFAGIMYFLLIIVAAVYVVHKFKQGRPFTIFNIYIYVMLFTYIIITPFQFSNQAWYKLDYVNAKPHQSLVCIYPVKSEIHSQCAYDYA